MSKAFTNEDSAAVERVVRVPPRLSPGEQRYVTPEGRRALQQELALAVAERERLSQSAEPAATLGSKEAQLAELEQKAQSLAATLRTLTVLPPDPAQQGRAHFGAWVTLEDDEGETRRYRLVGPAEADVKAGLISVDSPLARALLGKSPGDEVVVERPRGKTSLTLVDVGAAVE